MPVMRNFRKVMEKTQASYGLPASGPGANAVPGLLRAPRVERTPGAQAGSGHVGEHRCGGWCACEGRCAGGCGRKAEGVGRGEVLEVPDLWAGDAQTSCDIAAGRNRAGVRFEGCTTPTHLDGPRKQRRQPGQGFGGVFLMPTQKTCSE